VNPVRNGGNTRNKAMQKFTPNNINFSNGVNTDLYKKIFLVICLMLSVICFLSASDRDDQDSIEEKTKRIFELMEKLENPDKKIQGQAFNQLKEIGTPVIPFLIGKLKDKGIYLTLASQIQMAYPPPAEEIKANMKMWQDIIGPVSDKDTALAEKYLYSKYLFAVQYYQKENYQTARGIIDAILTLEPKVSFRNRLQQLRISCDEKMLQQNILRASLWTEKDIYEIGDQIKVVLKLQNVTADPLEVVLGKENYIVFNRALTQYDPFGNEETSGKMEEIKLTEETIKLEPLAEWTKTIVVDTSQEDPESVYYRTYDLTAEIRPVRIKSGRQETIRKIISLPLRLRVFPPDVDPTLKNPLGTLGKALQGGIPIDIFLCALLVPETDKDKALELLIRALPDAPDITKQAILTSLKHITNIPVGLEEEVWLKWWEERQKNR